MFPDAFDLANIIDFAGHLGFVFCLVLSQLTLMEWNSQYKKNTFFCHGMNTNKRQLAQSIKSHN